MVQTKRPRSRREMPAVHPDAAAIDVGATMHVVAVPPDRDPEPVRTFGTFTADLHRLADWLRACRIKSVVMESTGVYWIPIFEILEQKGFDVQLVNARDAKHVPGRKTDVSDAEWLQRLHEHGLLRGSFQPKGEVKALRQCSQLRRARCSLCGARSRFDANSWARAVSGAQADRRVRNRSLRVAERQTLHLLAFVGSA